MLYLNTQDAERHDSRNVGSGWALALLGSIWVRFFVLAGLSVILLAGGAISAADEQEELVSSAVKDQILASTIQIEMYDIGHVEDGMRKGHVNDGLATLIEHKGQLLVMTHNHWVISEKDLLRVELRDGYGNLLVVLKAKDFTPLVQYRDAGTLLFKAPAALSDLQPARLGSSSTLLPGDDLWITTRDRENDRILYIVEANVSEPGRTDSPAKLRLNGPRTAVSHGDSGGGVWHNGRLVGNMWAIITSLYDTPWEWLGWFSNPGDLNPTGAYIIARQPLSDSVVPMNVENRLLHDRGYVRSSLP